MWLLHAIVTLLFASYSSRAALQHDVDDSLQKMFDIRPTAKNNTDRVEIPGYMYKLYQDATYRRYDVIRRISPKTESLDGFMEFVYDLSALEPTEVVQKAVLQLEPRPNYRFSGAVNVSFFSLTKQTLLKTYLGSASISSAFDLDDTLCSQSLIDLDRLIVQMEGPVELSMGLVLYSKTLAGRYPKGHELAKFLFENTINKRRKRSVHDNEIDVKQNNLTDESKRKKKKKKGSKFSKLQAVDTGDAIVITNENQCRMEKLVLNFADIGWEDWVIYPKGFETNYCAGGCLFPLGKGSKPTNHATVQSLARSFGRLWDIPEPSCVPDTLAPLTLLYMDHSNHVLLKSYPDMRVVTCSCK